MAISYRERSYKTFGRVLAIDNGEIELFITLDMGPHIIRYARIGGENVMYEDVNARFIEKGECFDKYYYPGAYWYNCGGHRVWVTPESRPETYYPDNEPCEYTVDGNVFTFTPPAQRSNNIALKLIVTVDETGSGVTVCAEAKNVGDAPKSFGIWQITVACTGGTLIVPQTTRDTGLLHNRRISLWPYASMSDERAYWGKTLISLRQDKTISQAFKIGTSNERGYAAYLCNGDLFVKRIQYFPGVPYPDDGCNFETYTNDSFLEIESLGKMAPVAPGDTVSTVEVWSLTPDVAAPDAKDEAALAAILDKYVGK